MENSDKSNVFDKLMKEQPIFKNREVLSSAYVPHEFPHRDEQINEIAGILKPALYGARPSNILIYGQTGTGKTAVTKYICKQILAKADSEGKKIHTAYGGAHPPQRIENAIEEARYSVDPMDTVDKQVENVVKIIKPLIPISFEKIRVAVKILAIHVGKCYGQLSGIGKIENEEYQKDGSWVGIMEMSAASYNKLEDILGSITKGTAETKIL